MTTWSPDTCGCKLQINADWTAAEVLEKCRAHAGVKDADLFNTVYEKENKPKNQLCAHIAENFPQLKGDTSCQFMGPYGVAGNLSFDDDRKIVISIPGAKQLQKDSIKKRFAEVRVK